MRLVIRGLFRRRFRTCLTVFGVGVGIFGFVIMGAVAEKMDRVASNTVAFFSRYVFVLSQRGFFGIGGVLHGDIAREINTWPEVEYATPRIIVPLDIMDAGLPMSVCAVVGIETQVDRYQFGSLPLREGVYPPPGSSGLILLGDTVSRKYHKRTGDTFEVNGRAFTVSGVMDRLDANLDHAAMLPIDEVRSLFSFPADECTNIAVSPHEGVDAEALARRIEGVFPGVYTISPSSLRGQMESATVFANSLVYGATIVAVLAGALGIVNTMVMSVTERAREIATKKAIGAGTSQLFLEFLFESVVIATMGGAVGVLLGYLVAGLLNAHLGDSGVAIFLVTRRLVAWGMVVAVVVGCLAGVYPAMRAARTDPVRILRSV